MTPTLDERIHFITSLELEELPFAQDIIISDAESAAVDAGSSIAFVGNLPDQMKVDILNSTLLAQLSSNKKFDRQTQIREWYENYRKVLKTVGWTVEEFDFTKLLDPASYGSIDQLLSKLAAKYLAGGELVLFSTMIKSLRTPKNEAAYKLFDSQSRSISKANFQVGVASNDQGNAVFKIGAYTYSATKGSEIHEIFLPTLEGLKLEFYYRHQAMRLNNAIYSVVRGIVVAKLGKNARDLVRGIEL